MDEKRFFVEVKQQISVSSNLIDELFLKSYNFFLSLKMHGT